MKSEKFEVKSIEDLKKIIDCIKNSGKNIIILSGTLGSGKTTLVKEFVKSLGIKQDATSPTFAIQNIYDNKVFHYDLYNKGISEFLALGLLEEFEKEGYHFIEWGEDLIPVLENYGFDYLIIKIKIDGNKRFYECQNL
ncbi:tRNA threonylcarbamoyladenosine biosynthesis protein TsaE [Lebetimonas natsushimae]|uniref:tRNA threonylcarbamoyladenosine biosynthesis protein TsaE n=1 Tax=Lebetimonas natsushimae TaxID=1936991 RepID=A0A292YE36_9BACT|nr:tRNA (adenosine(37)-N6)-threonylcarbamoyltransferase complex ATPase subunit type 1 TsaE [Lebetimonas natsushimae]GAX87475.1 tRNA threonylcarbamoyladenosine biosynthesis protein TsaE [Lebetimonas natsushimae]